MNGSLVYVAFYKPDGVLTAFTDPEGRETLKRFIDIPGIYPAGRLDMDSEGLLLLTSDGNLAHKITDPAFQHTKTYLVQVEGTPQPEMLARLESGVLVKGRQTRRCQVIEVPAPSLPSRPRAVTPHGPTAWLRIVLQEGMKHQVRHMTAAVGLPTLRLVRIAIGSISLGELQPGDWRYLTEDEIQSLRQISRPRSPKETKAGRKPAKSASSAQESRYQNGARRRPAR